MFFIVDDKNKNLHKWNYERMLDDVFKKQERTSGFAQVNVLQYNDKIERDKRHIDVPLPGFAKFQIKLSVMNKILKIEAIKDDNKTTDYTEVIHSSYSQRSAASLMINIDGWEFGSSKFLNGILEISLNKIVTKEPEPKYLNID